VRERKSSRAKGRVLLEWHAVLSPNEKEKGKVLTKKKKATGLVQGLRGQKEDRESMMRGGARSIFNHRDAKRRVKKKKPLAPSKEVASPGGETRGRLELIPTVSG